MKNTRVHSGPKMNQRNTITGGMRNQMFKASVLPDVDVIVGAAQKLVAALDG